MNSAKRPLALRVGVIVVAAALMGAYIVGRQSGNGASRRVLTVEERDQALKGFVLDRYGGGGMITLDSLQKRVAKQRMLLPSSKSLRMTNTYEPEWWYLDSLIQAHGIEQELELELDSLLWDNGIEP